jgi:hypothetical protein
MFRSSSIFAPTYDRFKLLLHSCKGLSALLVPQVLPKSNFGPSTFFSLKLALKHLIRSTYHPWQRFWPVFFYIFVPRWKVFGKILSRYSHLNMGICCPWSKLPSQSLNKSYLMAESMQMEVWLSKSTTLPPWTSALYGACIPWTTVSSQGSSISSITPPSS